MDARQRLEQIRRQKVRKSRKIIAGGQRNANQSRGGGRRPIRNQSRSQVRQPKPKPKAGQATNRQSSTSQRSPSKPKPNQARKVKDLRQVIQSHKKPSKRSNIVTQVSPSGKVVRIQRNKAQVTGTQTNRKRIIVKRNEVITARNANRKTRNRGGNQGQVSPQGGSRRRLNRGAFKGPISQNSLSLPIGSIPFIAQAQVKAFEQMQRQQQSSHQVLVTNLDPRITQEDIMELFGDVGALAGCNIINPTTALVTYSNSKDAATACQTYHNRLLDGQPMQVNLMPNNNSIAASTISVPTSLASLSGHRQTAAQLFALTR